MKVRISKYTFVSGLGHFDLRADNRRSLNIGEEVDCVTCDT